MSLVPWILGAVGVLLLVQYFWKPGRKAKKGSGSPSLYVILHDGGSFQLYAASRSESGGLIVDGAEYPAGVARVVEQYNQAVSGSVYLIAVEPVALTKHRVLEQNRAAVIKGALFKSGGDLAETMRLVASCGVIAAAIFVYLAVSSLGGQMVKTQVTVDKMATTIASPLQVQK